jgi:hypothetical protein
MGSIKLQFAISDDLKQSVSVLDNETSNLLKTISDADKSLVKVRTDSMNASKQQQNQGKITSIAENKAKELGINASSIPGYNEALKSYQNLDSVISKANNY